MAPAQGRHPASLARSVPGQVEEARLRDFLNLPTLAGFEFSSQFHHSNNPPPSGQSTDEGQPGQQSGQDNPAPESQPGSQDGSPAGNAPASAEPIEGADTGNTLPNAPSSEIVPVDGETARLSEGLVSALDPKQNSTGGNGRLEMATAGLLGAHAVQIGRRTFLNPNVVKGGAQEGSGRWMAAKSGAAGAQEVLLDRRARPRAASAQRLSAGAIEQTARKWLDGALGMHSKVETSTYEKCARPKISIDWGKNVKPLGGQEKK